MVKESKAGFPQKNEIKIEITKQQFLGFKIKNSWAF